MGSQRKRIIIPKFKGNIENQKQNCTVATWAPQWLQIWWIVTLGVGGKMSDFKCSEKEKMLYYVNAQLKYKQF